MQFGAYTVVDRMTSGGTADIYRAFRRDEFSGRVELVVIKALSAASRRDEQVRNLFELEADLGRQLKHPNIVALKDLGMDKDELFLVLPYLDGPDFAEILAHARDNAPLPLSLAAFMLCKVFDALHYAHTLTSATGASLGLIHRDINPRNVLTTFDGEVQLIDFGIARTESFEGGSREDVIRGKLGYLSPEQLLQKPLDSKTDVFTAGVLAFELLVGRHPFFERVETADEHEVAQRIVEGKAIDSRALAPSLPEPLHRMLAGALEPRQNKRIASARVMHDTLQPYSCGDGEEMLAAYLGPRFTHRYAEAASLRYVAGV